MPVVGLAALINSGQNRR